MHWMVKYTAMFRFYTLSKDTEGRGICLLRYIWRLEKVGHLPPGQKPPVNLQMGYLPQDIPPRQKPPCTL